MSPKKINKEIKRREIALACFDLVHDARMRNLTVADVAKKAEIGKGTIYEYFENKDDIIFEIINMHIEFQHNEIINNIKKEKIIKNKVLQLFKFVTNSSEENLKHFNGYREYLSIVLAEENIKRCKFNNSCTNFFRNQLSLIIEEGIKNDELLPIARNFIDGIMIFEKGLTLMKMTQLEFNAVDACEKFLDNIFEVMEKKDDK
ncbi:TetR/AcrR family transcriptional regulator [Arcobacter sp.]|uniref:TetR/AcrR family transcriptional regulator n=1 Tax=unclassified Arcobacter TaxID=2593671 RepID=UPI003B009064